MKNLQKIWQWWCGFNIILLVFFVALTPINPGLIYGFLLGIGVTFISLISIQITAKSLAEDKGKFIGLVLLRWFLHLSVMGGVVVFVILYNRQFATDTLGMMQAKINLFTFIVANVLQIAIIVLANISLKKEV
ncbi:Uncharacterised protein [Mycoplasmopsis californica]|uniref:Uncharacterized protein n=1 Tax=Mycoplasmopsis equigenitalium TaxID=114883 RepID=A0ABY5J216_9BACT|nr:hypothetical protein [Mycoplasmopsis equigenitalium]UUD37295.1 hypothetical protein NPA09_01845 [Mycoplasmopsis equigenitalium]VEU69395.1 Uncharacterised protein [Mycoplasmopsis californica]